MRLSSSHKLIWDHRIENHWGFQDCVAAYIRAFQAKEEGDVYYRCYVPDLDPNVQWY